MRLLRHLLPGLALAGLLGVGLPAAAPAAPVHATTATSQTEPDDSAEAEPQDPADRVTWGIAPAGEDGADGRVSYRYELDPGDVVEDYVEVSNYSDRPIDVSLVSSDGVTGPNGAFDILPSAEEPMATGSWIDIQDGVELEAMSSAVVPFTMTIPQDVLPGDHPGGIAAVVTSVGGSEDGPAVGYETRAGARIHLRVSGEVTPNIAITDLTATYEPTWNPFQPGTLHLDYSVANEGNVRLGSVQSLTTSGLFDIPVGEEGAVVGNQREVLPRQGTEVSTEVTGVWPLGRLTSTVLAQQSIVGDDVVEVALSESGANITVWAVPWAQIALVALLGAFVVWRLRVRKRQRLALARARAEGEREASLSTADANS